MEIKMKYLGKWVRYLNSPYSKLGYKELFIKISEKSFFLKYFTCDGHTRTEVSKGLMASTIPASLNHFTMDSLSLCIWLCKSTIQLP